MDVDIFLPLLREALDRVDQSYYRHQLWHEPNWQEVFVENEDNPDIQELKKYLDRYGERVFCYELYHQVRVLMEQKELNHENEKDSNVFFQAELKKEQLHHIKQYFSEEIAPLEKAYIPDFLLHSPGDFNHQEIIIEVKSNPFISMSDIKDDLHKIHEFIERYHYRLGLFLTVNSHPQRIEYFIRRIIESNQLEDMLSYGRNIVIMCKPGQNQPLQEWILGNL